MKGKRHWMIKEIVLFRLFIALGRPFINKDCLKEEGEKLGFTEAGKQES